MPSKKKSESNPSGKDQAVGRNGVPKPTGSVDAKKSHARPEAGPDRKLAATTPSEKSRKASRINTTEHAKAPAPKASPAPAKDHATAQAGHKAKEPTPKPSAAAAKDHATAATAPKDHGPIPNPVQMSDTPAATKRRRGLVGRVVYGTAYAVSYGLAFPVMLLAHALPKDNVLVLGFVEGAGAARESVAGMLESPRALGHSGSNSSPSAALAAQPA
jgi:hypothetical protein